MEDQDDRRCQTRKRTKETRLTTGRVGKIKRFGNNLFLRNILVKQTVGFLRLLRFVFSSLSYYRTRLQRTILLIRSIISKSTVQLYHMSLVLTLSRKSHFEIRSTFNVYHCPKRLIPVSVFIFPLEVHTQLIFPDHRCVGRNVRGSYVTLMAFNSSYFLSLY